MTRFARASGSKASNQKVPEESTPWSLMRQQVAQGKTDLKQNEGKEMNWKTIINAEKEIEENKKSVWCSFEAEKKKSKTEPILKNSLNIELKPRDFHKKRKVAKENASSSNSLNTEEQKKSELSFRGENVSGTDLNSMPNVKQSDLKYIKAKLKLPKSKLFQVEEFPQSKTELCPEKNVDIPNSSNLNRRKSKSTCKKKGFADSQINDNDNVVNGISLIPLEKVNSIQKVKQKNEVLDSQNLNKFKLCDNQMPDLDKCNENSEIEVSEKNQCIDGSSVNDFLKDDENLTKARGFLKRNNTLAWKNQNKQERHSQPYKRRKVDEGDVKLEINGQEIWVTRLDGFYVKVEDAKRIRQLEKDLLKRGVSKQEVRVVIKKERRNAEKALARQKKKVCFHCRKGGHTLSSCPKLEDNGAQVIGSGICYKCGSTEHTHYQCKVNSGPSYKFATCFICKQEGHISKQCPDNPRGIYPSGGGCRLCGDVTHFRRECPTLQAKANKLTVGLIGQNVETLGDQPEETISTEPPQKKQKVIKFS